MAKKSNSSTVTTALAGACLTVLSGLCFGIGLEAAKSIYHKAAWLVIKKRYGADVSPDDSDDDDFFFDDEDDDIDDISDIDIHDLDEITDDDSSLFTKEDDIEIPCDSAVEDDGGDTDEQP